METVRRDLHQTTATVSGLLTKYSKLAASASTSYSSSGMLKDDLTRRKEEIEQEIDGAVASVSCFSSPDHLQRKSSSRARRVVLMHPLRGGARADLSLHSPTQFAAQIERLSSFHATAQPPPSASATHALERHREVLSEYKRDYARTKVCGGTP